MINFKIEREITTISSTTTTRKALTLTSWNGNEPKLDLRIWREVNGEPVPGKGLTLDAAEAAALAAALNEYLAAAGQPGQQE